MRTSKLIVICGSPAVGKSTYAKKLAHTKSAMILDSDTVSETLIQTSLKAMGHDPDDRDSEFYKSTFREAVYETLYRVAEENLAFCDVILVAPFTKEIRHLNWKNELEERFKVPVEVHYIYCPKEIKYERMKARGAKRDEAKLKDWETYLHYYGEEQPPNFEHLAIDSSTESD